MAFKRRGDAPLPPMPADPDTCRWCARRLSRYGDGTPFCQSGCAANNTAIYLGHCYDCERPFATGARWASTQCWDCSEREMGALMADYALALESEPPRWSKAAMRERLGVSGDRDE